MGKIVKLKNKKTGVRVYPVTATSAVVDANSGERLNDTLQNKVEEAPMDGNQYVRTNGVWSIAQMATSTKEKCIITLASNQGEGDAASLYGATVKVTDVDSQEVYHNGIWDGTEIALEFAPGVNYKVEVGAVADYATPESKTLTALDFNVRNLVMMYNTEVVSVTLRSDNGTSVAGQIVTINNKEYTFDGTNAVIQKIPYGVEYTVSANGKSSHTTPKPQTFVSSQVRRELLLTYGGMDRGVFIQDVNGDLYDEGSWDSSKTPNGIAVKTDECQFIVALNYASTSKVQIGESSLLYPDMDVISSKELAIIDYDGKGNTDKMIAKFTQSYYAAALCKNFTFPDGRKGYLGSAGEMNAFMNNLNKVNSLLSFVGASEINSGNQLWTSTRAANNTDDYCCFYRCILYANEIGKMSITDTCYVLPIAELV